MRVGRLDRIIYIDTDTKIGKDAAGGVTVTTSSTKTWASIEYVNRITEKDQANKVTADVFVKFTIRKQDITEKDRIRYNLETYDVMNVSEIGKRYLIVTGKKQV